MSYFHQNGILLISGNIFPSTDILVWWIEKLTYCLTLSMIGIEILTFIKEFSFTERLVKKRGNIFTVETETTPAVVINIMSVGTSR